VIGPRKHKNTKGTAHETTAKPRISRNYTERQSSRRDRRDRRAPSLCPLRSLRDAAFVVSCFRGSTAVRMSLEPQVNTDEHECLSGSVFIRGSLLAVVRDLRALRVKLDHAVCNGRSVRTKERLKPDGTTHGTAKVRQEPRSRAKPRISRSYTERQSSRRDRGERRVTSL